MEEGLVPTEIPPDPGGDLVQDGPVDTGIKQGPGPLKTTPPSPGDSSGSESEECLSRGKRRRPSDSGGSGAEGVASQTPLKISKIGEGGMNDASAPSSAQASPTKSTTSETAISVATPRSAAQVDKGKVGLPPPAKKDKAHAPAAPKEAQKGRKATNVPRNGTQGGYRRRPSQQGSRAPAFVDHPVVIHDLGGGTARFDKLGPWHRSQLLANAVGAVSSIRPLPSGKRLIGCSTEDQQTKLARLEALPGGVPIGARIPRPVVEGVVGPIPMGGEELRLVRKDLESGCHRVAGVTRLNNRKNELSMAVKISLEATELPEEVWLGATPYCVQVYAAPVRRCTKCQIPGARYTRSNSAGPDRAAAPGGAKVPTRMTTAIQRSCHVSTATVATRPLSKVARRCWSVSGPTSSGARSTCPSTWPWRGHALTSSHASRSPLHRRLTRWTAAGRVTGSAWAPHPWGQEAAPRCRTPVWRRGVATGWAKERVVALSPEPPTRRTLSRRRCPPLGPRKTGPL